VVGQWRQIPRFFLWMIGVVLAAFLVLALVVAAGVLYLGISMGNMATVDIFQRSTSPNGRWTVRAYDHNPGAAGHESYSADLVDKSRQGQARVIFSLENSSDAVWTKDGNHIRIRWLSNSVVWIGGHHIKIPNGYWSDD
jgi:hypothetical protein